MAATSAIFINARFLKRKGIFIALLLSGAFSLGLVALDWIGRSHIPPDQMRLAELLFIFTLLFIISARAITLFRRVADSETHFRMLTEDITETVWRQDHTNIVTYISPSDERMRGFPADDVVGRPVFDMLTEEGVAIATEAAVQGRTSVVVPARRKDGRPLWVDVTSTTEYDAQGNILGYHGYSRDITERLTAEAFEMFRSRILQMLAEGADLSKTLIAILTGIEKIHPEIVCSIVLIGEDGRQAGACIAPSLPDFFNDAIDRLDPGDGSRGIGPFVEERVVVEDIATHPQWAPLQDLAARAGLVACWSQPIHSSSHRKLGLFAIYHRQPNTPSDADINLIEQSARLVSIAIEKSQVDEALRESRLFVQNVLDSVTSQIAVINPAGTIVLVNDAWRRFSIENSTNPGTMAPRTDVGTNYFEICGDTTEISADTLDARSGIQAVLDGKLPTFSLDYPCPAPERMRWFTMTATPLRTGRQGAVIAHNDISERKLAEEKIQHLAFYDTLTSLPNRRLLLDRLKQAMALAKRSGCHSAMMFLDLDNFKPLNDIHGHDVGDLLLIEAARRLKASVRETDIVARFGGDEFVVMIDQISQDQEQSLALARLIAKKIRTTLSAPYTLTVKRDGEDTSVIEHRCTASIGVALFGRTETDQDDILKRADASMYQAKQSGRNTIVFSVPGATHSCPSEATLDHLLPLNWESAYQCGRSLIDEQHQALIRTANRLLAIILENRTSAEVVPLIETLLRDVAQHFSDEETIIAAAGFPGIADHVATHRDIVARANRLVDQYRLGALGIGELFGFLAHDLISRHMAVNDREFFPYLNPQRGR